MTDVSVVIVDGLGWESVEKRQMLPDGVWFRGTAQTPSNTTRALDTGAHVARSGSGNVLDHAHINVVECDTTNYIQTVTDIDGDHPIILVGTHNARGSNMDALDVPIAVLRYGDNSIVDESTNARHVDVPATVYRFLDEDVPETIEGVDLLDFDGVLAAYVTPGEVDGIIVPDGFLLSNGKSTVNQPTEKKLERMLDKIRDTADELVYRFKPNEEFMRRMGYL